MRVYGTKTMKLLVAAIFGTALTMVTAPASAAVVVVPNADTNVEANTNNGFPYNLGHFGLTAQRYQQVYAASQFGPNAGYITQIRYRPDAQTGGAFSMVLPGVEVFAPTAAMLFQFAEVGLSGREVRVADFYQPPWTHR